MRGIMELLNFLKGMSRFKKSIIAGLVFVPLVVMATAVHIIPSDTVVQGYLNADNLKLDDNTLSSSDTNGHILLDPNGSGQVRFSDLSASTVPQLDSNKGLVSSNISTTEFAFVDNVTSSLCGINQSCVVTNKSISGVTNTLTGIPLSAFTNLGTTTTVLHGNASGSPTFAAVTLTTDVTGSLPIANGGTGQATAIDGFNALSPLTTKGDLTGTNGSTASRLAVGADNTLLTADSSATVGFSWQAAGVTAHPLGYVSITGGTVTLTSSNEYVKLQTASATIALYTAVGNQGRMIDLQHAGTSLTHTYTLTTASAQTVNGIASGSYILHTFGETLRLISDNANWQVLNHYAQLIWTAYTPTIAGFGTAASVDFVWARSGQSIWIRGSFVSGTSTAVTGTVTLPGTINQTGGSRHAGIVYGNITTTATATPGATRGPWTVVLGSGGNSNKLLFVKQADLDAAGVGFADNGDDLALSGNRVVIDAGPIPITEFQP